MIYNVLDFGAIGDGTTDDSRSIQAAIDKCYDENGGRVYLPGGRTFLSGSIILKDNVELYIEKGATLTAAKDLELYSAFDGQMYKNTNMEVPSYVNCDYDGKPRQYFIYAGKSKNVSIGGFGVIDGSEEIFYGKKEADFLDGSFYPRIPLLYLEQCQGLTIRNVTLTRSAFWTVHMVGCEDVLIEGIRIFNNMMLANCDGIDPDHCKNVRISDVYIESADDCIVFKNTAAYSELGPCENITVTNSILKSSSSAIKFGTETCGEFKNITVDNCNISGQRGISLQLRDEGKIENVIFNNINIKTRLASYVWWGEADPISVTAIKRTDSTKIGSIRNVLFSNINCESENGIFIYGEENKGNISNIIFDKVNLDIRSFTDYKKGKRDIRPCHVKDEVFETGLSEIYIRHAGDITFDRFNASLDETMEGELFLKYDINDTKNILVNGQRVSESL